MRRRFVPPLVALATAFTLRAVAAPAAPPPGPPGNQPNNPPNNQPGVQPPGGFRLEPRPAFDEVFGDIESYRKTVDRFAAVVADMQQRREEFARAVQTTLLKLQPITDTRGRARVCPESDVAAPYARALQLGQDYLRSGRELTRHYEQIRELDRLGETVGLTPDYRNKVKKVITQYQALLTDYREMKVAFHDQLADELRYANCNTDKLLARAEATSVRDEPWPAPGAAGAPGVAPPNQSTLADKSTPLDPPTPPGSGRSPKDPATDLTSPPRSGIFIYIDNTRCATGTKVALDGKPVADVPAASRTALQTTPGPHDLCLIPDGTTKKCGDAGTVRRSYLHEGWTISLRCN